MHPTHLRICAATWTYMTVPVHLFQCLVIANEEESNEMRFEFKRATAVADAPALDFVKAENAPVALIGKAG